MEKPNNYYTTRLSAAGRFSAKIGVLPIVGVLTPVVVTVALLSEQIFDLKAWGMVAFLVLLGIWFSHLEKKRRKRVVDIVTLTSDALEITMISGVKRTMPYHSITRFVDERSDRLSPGLVIKSSLYGGGILFPAELENFKDFTIELHRRIKAKENGESQAASE